MEQLITKQAVQDILKTLPIGYYIGRDVPVEVDDSMTSHYDILNDIIRINTEDVARTINKMASQKYSKVETDTRAMLYHELSHAMLTPRSLQPDFHINVIEDARIQHINKDYFFGVDWEDFDKRYLSDTVPDCVENAFIRFCKLGEIPQVDSKSEAQFKSIYSDLEDLFRKYDLDKLNAYNDSDAFEYRMSCDYLYGEFKKVFNKSKKNQNQQSPSDQSGQNQSQNNKKSNKSNQNNSDQTQQRQSNGESSDQSGDQDNNSSNNSSEGNDSEEEENDTTSGEGSQSDSDVDDGEEKKTLADLGRENFHLKGSHREKLKAITQSYEDHELTNQLSVIISNYRKLTAKNSSAINSYSGVFDARATLRDDYKYFLQKNRQGNNKAFNKLHFNLFLDCSGSFYSNERTALEILKALCWLEKQIPDFSFTLITCGVGETIVPKKNLEYSTDGGTELSKKIFTTFEKVQVKDAVNFNIVLYDGAAVSYDVIGRVDDSPENFAAFNTPNTIIITDSTNGSAVMRHCPKAQKIISQRYTQELKSNLLKMLKILLK